jgi:hypothetical protein
VTYRPPRYSLRDPLKHLDRQLFTLSRANPSSKKREVQSRCPGIDGEAISHIAFPVADAFVEVNRTEDIV